MTARAKNIWAALVLALSCGCNRAAELDEIGQQQLAQHLSWRAEMGFEEVDVARQRKETIAQRHRERFFESSDAEAEQFARQQTQENWRTAVCDKRKPIRLKFYCAVLLALLSVDLKGRGARNWGDGCALLALGLACLLAAQLDEPGRDAECEETIHRSLAARAAGDWQKSAEFLLRYNEISSAKIERNLQVIDKKVELLTRQIHHEPRN